MQLRRLCLVVVAVLAAATASAGAGLTPPPCKCNGEVRLVSDPRGRSTNVALTMANVYLHLQPGSPNPWQRFGVLTAAMLDAYALTSGAHPPATASCVDGARRVDEPEAVAYAAYAVLLAAYADEPDKRVRLDDLMRHHGLDAAAVRGHVGALAARAVMRRHPLNPAPIPLRPPNEASADGHADCRRITRADGWQPLCTQAAPGPPCTTQAVVFGALLNATLYASGVPAEAYLPDLPPLPTYTGDLADLPFRGGRNAFADQHLAVLRASAGLGDYEKALVQLVASGTSDRITLMAVAEAEERGLSLGASAALLHAVAAAIHDSSAVTTTAKFRYASARSVSVIQCAYAGRRVEAWAGPYQGVRPVRNAGATRWRPYWATPPHPGFISGATAAAAAGVEVLTRAFGDHPPRTANCQTLAAGASAVEPRVEVGGRGYIPGVTDVPNWGPATGGYAPARDVTLCWPTWRRLGRLVADSRLYAGVHIPADNEAGLVAGRAAGSRAWEYVQRVVGGTGGCRV